MSQRISVVALLTAALFGAQTVAAEGEAGILSIRGQGHFYTGVEVSAPEANGAVAVKNQTYVGFQLPAVKTHPYPLVLVHGGGGQSTEWFSTPDGRDGWRDYFVAAGFDVYWIDRPGFGRSPTHASYGEMHSGNTQIVTFLANAQHWPGDSRNHQDPTILAWLASAPPGPYAGNRVAAKGLSELLDRIGPAILLTHSAGAVTGWWAADMSPTKVAGIIALEPGASNVTTQMRGGLTFAPALDTDFAPVKDEQDCPLQGKNPASQLVNYRDIEVHLVGSELGLVAALPCAEKAFRQAGVKVKYTYLPDLGFTGNGHYMMAESNNGELAGVIIKLAEEME